MALFATEPFGSYAGSSRWDAEYYANTHRPFIEAMLNQWPDWRSLDDAAEELSSGHTPSGHDLEEGGAGLITIDCVDPLRLDRSRVKPLLEAHVTGELSRARVQSGDIVVTIKRRLLNASPVIGPIGAMACNQDVVRIKPKADVLPGFLAAVLNSRLGKAQAARNATEQINPYLSIPALKAIRIPRVDPAAQTAVDDLVTERIQEFDACMRSELEAEQYLSDALGLTGLAFAVSTASIASFSTVLHQDRLDPEYFCFPDVDDVWKSPFRTLPLADDRVTSHLAGGVTPTATQYADEGKPIIKVGSVSGFGLAEWRGDRVRPDSPAASGERGRCLINDVLMLSAAHHVRYIGRSGLLRELPDGATEGRSVGELITVRAAGALSPETLVTYLNLPAVRLQVQRLVRGQSAHLYSRDLAGLPVPLVPREIQDEVGRRLQQAFTHRVRAGELAAEAMARVEELILDH